MKMINFFRKKWKLQMATICIPASADGRHLQQANVLSLFILAGVLFVYGAAGVGSVEAAKISMPGNGLVLNAGLVGWWTFDGADVTDKVYDKSGQGNNGYFVGGATSTAKVPGKIGQALNFNKNIDYQYFRVPYSVSLTPTNAISFGAWVKTSNKGLDNNPLISKTNGGGWNLYFNNTSPGICQTTATLCGLVNIGGTYYSVDYPTSSISNNVWYHVFVVYDKIAVRLYLNGVQVDSTNATGDITYFTPTNVLCIGGEVDNAFSCREGNYSAIAIMDDVRIYSRALSATEVKTIYNQGGSKISSSVRNNTKFTNGLVGHWTFDGADVTDKVYDKSGQGNNGYYIDGATSTAKVAGKMGQALKFSGNENVKVLDNSSLDIQGNITLAMWVKRDRVNYYTDFLNKVDGDDAEYEFYALANNSLEFYSCGLNPTYVTSVQTFADTSKWHYLVLTRNNNVTSFYYDGVFVDSFDQSGSMCSSNRDVYIGGANSQNTDHNLEGSMDDVRIYNRALSAAEVKELYTFAAATTGKTMQGVGSAQSSLSGWWTFDGADVTDKVYDKSGQGNNGYFLGGATSTAKVPGKIGQGMEFDGVDDYIKTASGITSISPTTAYTIIGWVKHAYKASGSYFIASQVRTSSDRLSLYVAGTATAGKMRIQFGHYNGTDYTSAQTAPIDTDKWHFFAAVNYADRSKILYVDGTAYPNTEVSGTSPGTSTYDNFFIGSNVSGTSNFDGAIDDIRVYGKTLTAAEVAQIYNLGR